jgi:hypothetical protein
MEKLCVLCNTLKSVDKFVKNKTLENGQIEYKKKCKECYKFESKKFYNIHKTKILKSIKDKSDKLRKEYNIKIKFNDLQELDQIYNDLKLKLQNNTLEKFKSNRCKTNDNMDNKSNDGFDNI